MDNVHKSHEGASCKKNLIKHVKIVSRGSQLCLESRNPGVVTYLLHYSPGDRCVRAEQNLPHQHGFEERPGDGSSSGVDHVQVHVHAEGS